MSSSSGGPCMNCVDSGADGGDDCLVFVGVGGVVGGGGVGDRRCIVIVVVVVC